jgi:hypothetical protein
MQAFISYAHDDHRAFEEFETCLRPVARAFAIEVWADKRLRPRHYWREKIAEETIGGLRRIVRLGPRKARLRRVAAPRSCGGRPRQREKKRPARACRASPLRLIRGR